LPASYFSCWRSFQAGSDFQAAPSLDVGDLILSDKTVVALNWPLTSSNVKMQNEWSCTSSPLGYIYNLQSNKFTPAYKLIWQNI
jgi:hypothetical protein